MVIWNVFAHRFATNAEAHSFHLCCSSIILPKQEKMKQSQEICMCENCQDCRAPPHPTPTQASEILYIHCFRMLLTPFQAHWAVKGRLHCILPGPCEPQQNAFPPQETGRKAFSKNSLSIECLHQNSSLEMKGSRFPLVPFASSVHWFSLGLLFWRE